ncbi:MAG: M3 family metallopeptidase [Candidatus Caenarcaniphilales bacterium]|nr:M3 family metallopeptidase [Candidatus Caenarcaniphilales bacterium]
MSTNQSSTLENPLLDYDEMPEYSKVKVEHVMPGIIEAKKRTQIEIDKILKLLDNHPEDDNKHMNFENTLIALEDAELIFDKATSVYYRLKSVNNTKEFRAIEKEVNDFVSDYHSYLANDDQIAELIQRYLKTSDAKSQKAHRARYIEDVEYGLKVSGALLNKEDKAKFNELNKELASLNTQYNNNCTDSRMDILIKADEEDKLKGLTDEDKKMLKSSADSLRKQLAEKLESDDPSDNFKGKAEAAQAEALKRIPEGSFILSGDYAVYPSIRARLDDAKLRKELTQLGFNICGPEASRGLLDIYNNEKNSELDNTEITKRILEIRQEKARLVGFENHAQLTTKARMAGTPEKVLQLYEDILTKAKPQAEREYKELVKFQNEINYKNTENDEANVYPWDSGYLVEKLQKRDYDIDDKDTRPYFEYHQTFQGMLDCTSKLFDINFKKANELDVLDLNKGGEAYRVYDNKTERFLGTFFTDPFERSGTKRAGAWAILLRPGYKKSDGTDQRPLVNITCNFNEPSEAKTSQLSHREVTTLFHEFGHALHSLLSETELASQFGRNVAKDFVELPSQLLENFAFDKDILQSFAKNSKGKVIPDELVEKLNKVRNFRAATQITRQISFGKPDMLIYNQKKDDGNKTPIEVFTEVADELRNGPKVFPYSSMPNSFQHIFPSGYSAGYYSYLWSEILEADAFSEFMKGGGSTLKPDIGKKYRETILAVGDSIDPIKAFENFTGRDKLDPSPLLERAGLR